MKLLKTGPLKCQQSHKQLVVIENLFVLMHDWPSGDERRGAVNYYYADEYFSAK